MDATMRCRIDLFLFPTFPPLVSVSDKLSRCLTLSSCERRQVLSQCSCLNSLGSFRARVRSTQSLVGRWRWVLVSLKKKES